MKIRILIAFIFICQLSVAQTKIIIPNYVRMPKDSIVASQIINDLNSFLKATQEINEFNKYVLPTEKVETFILIDEFKEVEKFQKNEHFFKPYLDNIVKLDSLRYLIQISHIGVYDSMPYLRTVYNLIANKKDNSFLFSSPLKENTRNWKSKTLQNFTFYFKDTLNLINAANYVKLASTFDKKLCSKNKTTKIYYSKNNSELLNLIGINYKLDYNGRSSGIFSALNGDEQVIVFGSSNDNFDPHDLWHDRLSLVISRRKVNKPVDEGCAYLYGGSWGMSWNEIFEKFLNRVTNKKNTDWTFYKENTTNFGDSMSEYLIVDYVINALIIQKIEKEKGFSGVWELLNCGKYEKGNENYYSVLNKIIGINKANYNKIVWELIKNEKKKPNN